MATRDIIVVGASAGGVTALKDFVKGLPGDFPGTVFVVLHIPPYSETQLPEILSRAGPLEAILAKDGEKFQAGKIYIAPNNKHLLLEDGRIMVKTGPKENKFRPSIDALFRSAAYVYGTRVVGIILSGVLNDGTSGLWSVKRLGGIAIIQDPREAEQSQMPENVLEYVEADYIMSAGDMGLLVGRLVQEAARENADRFKFSEEELKRLEMEIVIATKNNRFEMKISEMGELTSFTCPECHGVMVRLVEGNIIRYRCQHTGHAYTSSSLLAEVTESVEDMLWQSMRGMEEMNILLKSIADHFEKTMNNPDAAKIFRKKAKQAADRARIIHESVFSLEQYSEDIRLAEKEASGHSGLRLKW